MAAHPRGSISRRVALQPGATGEVVLEVGSSQWGGDWTLWAYQNDGTVQTVDWTLESKGAESVQGDTIFRTGPAGGQLMAASGPFTLRASLPLTAPAPVQLSIWLATEAYRPTIPIECFDMGILAGAAFQPVGPRAGFPPPE